ncbi:GNAT family N-acetyltransferase [Streptomyces sp. 5-10]|uniref:GNAT family N-acetyltransferase n=1 Tax=Streptomyces sp. 5-10 TaxID=878925 RepID=UPI00351A14B1
MAREPARTLARDGERLITWCEGFARETAALMDDVAAQVDDKLGHDGITVWELDGRPVACAGISRTIADMARVALVYTPPELRGRGYAGAATAAVSRAARAAGVKEVLLFADLDNLTSNALYQRLGYRPVGTIGCCPSPPPRNKVTPRKSCVIAAQRHRALECPRPLTLEAP